MDELTLLRRTREDVAAPDPAALAAARARLLAQVDRRPGRPRRTTRLVLGLATAAAVATVVAIGVWPSATPPATAAGLLHQAADSSGSDPVAGPGEYLAVETRERAMDYLAATSGDGYVGGVLTTTVTTTYVPHDRDDAWVRRSWSEPHGPVWGGAAMTAYADRTYAEAAHADDPTVERAVGGTFGNGELGGGSATAADPASMPRDPEQLLRSLQDLGGGAAGGSGSEAAITGASTLLRTGTAPRDLRSAVYDALALLPDVVVVDQQLSLDGRTGTAIGVRDGFSLDAVVIDTDTGDYLGQYQTQSRDFAHVPAGTVIDQTSVRVSVVDSAP